VCHDHVVTIHAVDEDHQPPYLVMQFVEGVSLQDKLDRGGPLRLTEILRIGVQMAAGLTAAHAQGLVHRDIKPANILLENGVERVKITDFGLARAVGDGRLTGVGVLAGTPQYMAPEQASSEGVDYRSDLFSLGSVLYALCTGQTPFPADNALAVLRKVCEEAPRPIREANPLIPEWLVAIVARLQAKNPAERFASAAEVGKLLGEHLARLQQPPPADAVAPTETATRPASAGARRPRFWAVAALLILLGGGALAATLLGLFHRAAETDSPAATTAKAGSAANLPELSVLDRLDPAAIPAEERFDGQPQELVAVLGEHRQRHWEVVLGVAASPNGKLVASTGIDNLIMVADADTMRIRAVLRGHSQGVSGVAFSPDSRRLLSAGRDGTIRLWDIATGKECLCFHGPGSLTRCVCFSPDGQRALSGGSDGLVRLWDVSTGEQRKQLAGHTGAVIAVAFAPDGERALSGGHDHTARVWDLKADKEVCHFQGHTGVVAAVAFLPDGSQAISANGHQFRDGVFSAAGDYRLRLWDTTTGKELQALEGHQDGVTSLDLAADGRHAVSAAWDETVRYWDVETGLEARCLRGHQGPVLSTALLPDGRRAISGGNDSSVRLWDLDSGRELSLPAGHRRGPAACLAFSSDGRHCLSGAWPDKSLRLWDLSSGKEVRTFEGHTLGIWCLAFSQDGQFAYSGSADSTLRIWEVASGKEIRKFEGHTGWVVAVALPPDGRVITGAWGKWDLTVRYWDPASGQELKLPFQPPQGAIGIALTPDGRKALTGGLGKTVSLWDIASGAELLTFQGHTATIVCVAITPDGRQAASCGHDRTIWLWSLTADGKPGRKFLNYHTGTIRCVAFSPDGKTLASSGADSRVILWDVATGDRLQDWQFPAGSVNWVAFAPDGRHLATANANGTIYLLRPRSLAPKTVP
jgi:WD40 repeat protein